MLRKDSSIQADHDAIGIAWPSTGRPTALPATEYLLLSKRTRLVFETDAVTAWR